MVTAQNHKLCMIPGPVEFHEHVLAAMSTPATSHTDPGFISIFGESIEMLRKVLLTKTAQPFIVSGSGTLGWDMMSNLVEKDDEVLILNTGYFGDRFGDCLEVYGANVTHVRAPIGDRPSLDDISTALSSGKKYKLVTITHVDTSTGVLSDVKSITQLVKSKSPETLVIVDGVCSVGCEEIRMEEWGVDVVLTASQKALGVPPGLCIVLVGQQAMNVFKTRKSAVPNYFAGWSRWLPIMQAYESRKPSYFATPAVQLIYGLHTSLSQVLQIPVDDRFHMHRTTSLRLKEAVSSFGLKQLPVTGEIAANGMTAVWYPDGVQASDLLPRLAKKNIQVAGGLHVECASKYFRIGHMGISVTEPWRGHIDAVIDALRTSLKELGHKL